MARLGTQGEENQRLYRGERASEEHDNAAGCMAVMHVVHGALPVYASSCSAFLQSMQEEHTLALNSLHMSFRVQVWHTMRLIAPVSIRCHDQAASNAT